MDIVKSLGSFFTFATLFAIGIIFLLSSPVGLAFVLGVTGTVGAGALTINEGWDLGVRAKNYLTAPKEDKAPAIDQKKAVAA